MYIDRINPDLPEGRLLVSSRGFELKDPTLPTSSVPLEQKADKLFQYIEQHGFERKTMLNMRRTYSLVSARGGLRSMEKYNTLLREHPADRTFFSRWLLYDYYDMLPSNKRIHASNYAELSPYYRHLVDDGMRAGQWSGIRDLTISVEASVTTNFLYYLQGLNVNDLSQLSEKQVRDYTRYGTCGPMILYRVSVFLRRYAIVYDDTAVASVLHFFPKEKLVRKVYQALTGEERKTLEQFLLSEDCPLCKRDRAVVILMLYLGMRSNDVGNLRLGDIDWEHNQIRFLQGKTLGEMTLPLRPVVGNALYDYIVNERPKCDEDRLFISHRPYAGAYGKCGVNGITNRAYDLAGIRKGNVRKGTHLLRHSLADEMVNQGNDITMVTKTLGHLNPNTTLGYLSSNIEQLRLCALSIEPFPVHSKYYRHE